MARKRKPFQQKRQPYAPYRRGRVTGFYFSDELIDAIADVARARDNISRSELVSSILTAHPDIAAQLALYQHPDRSGSDQDGGAYSSLFDDQPDLWGSDQGEAPDQPDGTPDQCDQGERPGERDPSDQRPLLWSLKNDPTDQSDQRDQEQGKPPTSATRAIRRRKAII